MMNVAAWSGYLLAWKNELSSLKARRCPVFCRRELRETGGALLDGLLSGIACKIGWMMSGQAALAVPADPGFPRPQPPGRGRSARRMRWSPASRNCASCLQSSYSGRP